MTDMWLLSTSVRNPCQKLDYGFLTAVGCMGFRRTGLAIGLTSKKRPDSVSAGVCYSV